MVNNLKSITIEELLEQCSKKASYELIYISYLIDIIHNLLEQKQSAIEMSLEGDSEKAYEQAYDDMLRLAFKFIMNKLYGTQQTVLCNSLYTDTDSISKRGENE